MALARALLEKFARRRHGLRAAGLLAALCLLAVAASAQVTITPYNASNGAAVFTAYPDMVTADNILVVGVPSGVAGYPQGGVISGPDKSYFQYDTLSPAYTCPSSGSFSGGLDCELPIYFVAPSTPGTYTATMTFTYEDPSNNLHSGAVALSATVLPLPASTTPRLAFLPTVTVIAGTGAAGYSGNNGPAIAAKLNSPSDVAIDSKGNIYVADTLNFVVRKIDSASGDISVYAGTPGEGYPQYVYTGEGGAATSAVLTEPVALAVDSSDNVYISDYPTSVRKVDAQTGIITTYAGPVTYQLGYTGDGGPATSALFGKIGAIAMDASNNLYIADVDTGYVRKVDASGTITAYAGQNFAAAYANHQPLPFLGDSGDGGPATGATLSYPSSLAVDSGGNLYIADTHSERVRMVNAKTGIITSVAGMDAVALGTAAQLAAEDLPATGAAIGPIAVAANTSGQAPGTPAYAIIDFQGLIFQVDSSGVITQFPSASYTTLFGAGGYMAGAKFTSDGRLIATAQERNAVYSFSAQASLNFGDEDTGSTSNPMYLTLINNGAAPIDFSAAPYSVTRNFAVTDGGTCSFTEQLAANSSCTVAVTFTPQTSGALTGTVSFSSNDPASPLVAQLSGTGVGAATASAALSIPNLAFPVTPVGQTASLTEKLTNTGTGQLNITGITLTGANPSQFFIDTTSGTCTATLSAGSSCNIVVDFTPQAANAYAATLNVSDNASGSPQTAGITGTGEGAAVLNIQETIHINDTETALPAVALGIAEVIHVNDVESSLPAIVLGIAETIHINDEESGLGVKPVITWTTPSPIVYGTPLGAAQLDASASVAGTFTYSPAAGAILSAGAHTLSVKFTPQNTAEYQAALASVTLTVDKANPEVSVSPSATTTDDGAKVTFTALVQSPSAGTPTGTVTFFDGSTSIGSSTLSNGSAALSTSQLGIGTHAITAQYSGDADFNSGVSSAANEQISTFTLSLSSTQVVVLPPGNTAISVIATPSGGSFTGPITLTATGLPPGVTATFTPSTLAPGSAAATSMLKISPSTGARNHIPELPLWGGAAGTALCFVAGFFVPRRRALWLGMLIAVIAVTAFGIAGCGSSNTASYSTVIVTATAGTDVQSTTFKLTVQ